MPYCASFHYVRLFQHLALACLAVALPFLLSCKQTANEQPYHANYFSRVFDSANNLQHMHQFKLAIAYLDSAYSAFPQASIADVWQKYSYKAEHYRFFDPDLPRARLYIDSMFYLLKDKTEKYRMEYAKTLFAEGEWLMAEKKYNEAFKCFYDGKIFAQKNLDSCNYAPLTGNLGLVKYRQGNYLGAIPYLLQAMDESNHCRDSSNYSSMFLYPQSDLNAIALCYEKAGMPDSAVHYYNQALTFINQRATIFHDHANGIEMAKGVVYGNLGGVYARLKDYNKALYYLKESIRINNREGYEISDAQTAQVKLARLYLQFSHLKEADTLLSELGNNLSTDDLRLKWYQLKWNYADKMQNLPQSHYYMQRYYELHDSIAQVNTGLKAADLEETFKDAEQQYKLNLLNKRDELKTVYLSAIILFSVMALIILFMVWHNLKRSKRNVAQLTMLNRQISEQNVQMQNALTSLEQSQEENTRLMKVVAHDLRNPVAAISSMASLMLEDEYRLDEDREMLDIIKTSGQNAIELINNLLQTNMQREVLKKEPVDLHVLLQYCVDLLRFKAGEKEQHIHLHAGHATALLDREKMWRVISNLIANAIKFSPSGADIIVQMESDQHNIRIAVEDHGIGIPPDLKDKIFDIYTPAKRSGTAGEQPFGMGLAISKQIIIAHNGNIWFESKPGNGTIFYITLPRSTDAGF